MHRCFGTLDILHIVFSGLEPHHLTSVARTCKTFCSPALDYLWRDQDGFKNILQCMSPDLWQENEVYENYVELSLRRPIVPQDWSRFGVYADRAKCIRLDDDFFDDDDNFLTGVDPISFSALMLATQRLPLLRYVRSLECDLEMPHNVCALLRLALGPNIFDLTLDLLSNPSITSRVFGQAGPTS
ncbi:hypothetical protein PLICRDRAFT_125798 [Plicaturopsis crispa FD-325 SS-3]|nr:hypothetical protein PLICRDRAFT_125798 [Plicaturopsis crispa FD-325 SS-3]